MAHGYKLKWPQQNGHHIAANIFKCILLIKQKKEILNKISLKYV